jgi:hypothetical protein
MCFVNIQDIYAQITDPWPSLKTVLFRIWCSKWKFGNNVASKKQQERWFRPVRIHSEYLWCLRQLLIINSQHQRIHWDSRSFFGNKNEGFGIINKSFNCRPTTIAFRFIHDTWRWKRGLHRWLSCDRKRFKNYQIFIIKILL